VQSEQTLAAILRRRADEVGDRIAVRFKRRGGWEPWTWSEFYAQARGAALALSERGIAPGDRVLAVVPEVDASVALLTGLWLLGAVPIQVGLPYRLADPLHFAAELAQKATDLRARAIAVSASVHLLATLDLGVDVIDVDEIARLPDLPERDLPGLSEWRGPALIQLTSGTTAKPRGVVISGERLLLHLSCMSRALQSHANSAAVSWLPLHHDMGLIGGLLFPFFNGFTINLMSPIDFRTRPLGWIEAMSEFSATICAAPPSAYSLVERKARHADLSALDLRAWECAMVGAEPIPAAALRRFSTTFAPTGFRSQAFFPVYGLAEATVAVTFPSLLAQTIVDRIDRTSLEWQRRAVPTESEPLELTGVGEPIPETSVKILDEDGRELPERQVGEITVRASTLMEGYFDDAQGTGATVVNGWLKTGDLGYFAKGVLFVAGRKKDVIIRAGQNLSPESLEEATEAVDGIRIGCVAAVGLPSPDEATDVVCIVAEVSSELADVGSLRKALFVAAARRGLPVDRVFLVKAGALPKTTSGKIMRSAVARGLTDGTVHPL
jgi:acyl-CoA synthetase (AMP-forming)/AMP-acid ligase II